ncbi:hypothetical protein HMI54_006033 [Coelomomyces lativittatus]|nr:hypothetical protein HMI55_003384 [Coelomomyces lativittatus]KAJ1504036.1 hypothetical protein HMI56_001820 [Coelomomyces lativittatus]KAJ1505351.1 hypothetical protein HMI54_006033 [Coelomomyces lativittatus]
MFPTPESPTSFKSRSSSSMSQPVTTPSDSTNHDAVFITQQAGKLLEDPLLSTIIGKNQPSVHLVHRRREMRYVQQLLDKKRTEFAKFMEECKDKQDELKVKQRQLKERVQKFEKFLRDNETKKQRALAKAVSERKLKELKEIELIQCQEQLKKELQKSERIQKLINFHKPYEQYMLLVLSNLPSDYLDVQDPHLNDILQRHQTLSETRSDLQTTLQARLDGIESLTNQLSELVKLKNDRVLVYNSQMGALQKRLDRAKTEATRIETMVGEKILSGKTRMRMLSETKLAISNVYMRMGGRNNVQDHSTLSEKLTAIQERILDLAHIASKVEGFLKEEKKPSKLMKQPHHSTTENRVYIRMVEADKLLPRGSPSSSNTSRSFSLKSASMMVN